MEELSRRDRDKNAHETEILEAAERIFIKRGYDGASIDEIAREANFTRRTLYQYFKNKEDMYFCVVKRGFQDLYASIAAELEGADSGFEKLRKTSLAYYRFYTERTGLFKLMNYLGYVRKTSAKGERERELLALDDFIFSAMIKLMDEGKKDGSIRGDIPSGMGAYSAIFILSGFFYQLSLTGTSFTEHFSLEREVFDRFGIDLLLKSFRA